MRPPKPAAAETSPFPRSPFPPPPLTPRPDLDKKRFRIVTREAFGTGNHTELIIEAPNQRIKNRWLFNLRQEENSGGGFRGHEGRLMVEGALIKVQPVGTTSKVAISPAAACTQPRP